MYDMYICVPVCIFAPVNFALFSLVYFGNHIMSVYTDFKAEPETKQASQCTQLLMLLSSCNHKFSVSGTLLKLQIFYSNFTLFILFTEETGL